MAERNSGRGAVYALVVIRGRLQVTGLLYEYAKVLTSPKVSALSDLPFEVAANGCGKITRPLKQEKC
jgi:hypothetical protein